MPQLNTARPYMDADVPPPAFWRYIDAEEIEVEELIPTQYYLVIDRLFALAMGGDCDGLDIPHIIVVAGRNYLHDGHHRWALAIFAKQERLRVRRFHFDPNAV